jgi:hypothetical protein
MSWLTVQGSKGDWTQARPHENLLGNDWYDGKSQPLKILLDQKTVTLSSFFTNIGDSFLGLK